MAKKDVYRGVFNNKSNNEVTSSDPGRVESYKGTEEHRQIDVSSHVDVEVWGAGATVGPSDERGVAGNSRGL